MPGIASFRPGVWNGKPHDAKFVKALADNFQKYSTGANPYYSPYISINHDDTLQAGRVSAAGVNGDTLFLDGDGIPEPVGAWRNAGGLVQPSIEYFEPVYDESGRLVDGFRKPDGTIEPGPVLKCLTLLGADAPAVKGLPALPFAQFSHAPAPKKHGGRVFKFANQVPGVGMDRAGMLAALQALGFDVSAVTDAVPDEVIKSWLEGAQKMQAGGGAATPTPTDTPPVQMADGLGGVGAAPALPPATGGIPGVTGNPQPSSVVLKFSDTTPTALQAALAPILQQTQATLNALNAQAANAQRQLAAVNQAATQQAHAAKFADVSAFVNRLATKDAQGFVRIQPAQKAFFVQSLMMHDNATVRKFADGKSTGTALAEAKAVLESTLPKLRVGVEKMPDAAPGTPGGKPGTTGAGGVDADRRQRMLSATPEGRRLLAAQEKKTA